MKRENIKYEINKEKRTVVAYCKDIEEDLDTDIDKVTENIDVCLLFDTVVLKDNIVKGIAKCDPRDEWDEEIGKRVARQKLYRTYNRIKRDQLHKVQKELERFEAQLEILDKKYETNSQKPIFEKYEDDVPKCQFTFVDAQEARRIRHSIPGAYKIFRNFDGSLDLWISHLNGEDTSIEIQSNNFQGLRKCESAYLTEIIRIGEHVQDRH